MNEMENIFSAALSLARFFFGIVSDSFFSSSLCALHFGEKNSLESSSIAVPPRSASRAQKKPKRSEKHRARGGKEN